MGGRSDYEERKQRRINRCKVLSEKAKKESEARYNSTANRILMGTPGQPIIIGHHSERKARRLHEQANNDIRKSIELSEKSEYYESRARNAENSNVIYNDDPNAILKLKDKLEKLENQRASIKAREHEGWELTNIGANIRETKLRIKRLEEQETLVFPDTEFKGGKAIHNKEINRIQLLFASKPDDNIRSRLKHNGFHWSRIEGAWQREFNKRTIYVTNALIKDVLNKEKEESEEFE
ncbi:MAG: DUF3560 domain-containing protein [Clostridia bacterium]|nr:DUF3560 domain-containing protein [Clostridia bacterium]